MTASTKSRRPNLGNWNGPGWAWGGPHDDRNNRHGSGRSSNRDRARPRRRRPGPEAHRRRLWVLDLHPQRHRHVFGAVRSLCGPVGEYRPGTDRARAVRPAQCLHRDDVSVALELHLRARGVVRRTAAVWPLPDLRCPHIRAGCGLSVHRSLGICRHGSEGRRALAQRLSVQLLHLGRYARRACHRRADLAHLSGGSGRREGLASRRAPAPVVLEPVLARAGHRLGRGIHVGLSDGRLPVMDGQDRVFDDRTPGVEEQEPTASYLSYTAGLGLAILATLGSFVVSQTNLLWAPGIPVGLIVLAFAQIGVHLVFFLHLGSGPDSTNNILALAFGVLIVFLVITGSCWIIANLNDNMMAMPANMAR